MLRYKEQKRASHILREDRPYSVTVKLINLYKNLRDWEMLRYSSCKLGFIESKALNIGSIFGKEPIQFFIKANSAFWGAEDSLIAILLMQ